MKHQHIILQESIHITVLQLELFKTVSKSMYAELYRWTLEVSSFSNSKFMWNLLNLLLHYCMFQCGANIYTNYHVSQSTCLQSHLLTIVTFRGT